MPAQGETMALKDLLVIVDNDPAGASRVEIARRLAEAHEAHLTGLHVMPPPMMMYARAAHPGVAGGLAAP